MYNVTLWRFRVTIVAVEKQKMHSVRVVELHVTVNNIKILSVAQQCFCGFRIFVNAPKKHCNGMVPSIIQGV
jgi:hypothetical protein